MANHRGTANTPAQNPMQQTGTSDPSLLGSAKEKVENAGQAISEAAGAAYQKTGDYVSGATSKAKEAIGSMGEYLHQEDIRGMADDVTEMIKHYPLPAICVSFGLGMFLASLSRRS